MGAAGLLLHMDMMDNRIWIQSVASVALNFRKVSEQAPQPPCNHVDGIDTWLECGNSGDFLILSPLCVQLVILTYDWNANLPFAEALGAQSPK